MSTAPDIATLLAGVDRLAAERDEALRVRDDVDIDPDTTEDAIAEAIASLHIEWEDTPDPAPDWLVAPILAAVRPGLVKALAQRDRYHAAWRSARRRALRLHRKAGVQC